MGLALWALPQVANAETVTDTHAEPLRPKKQYIVAAIGDSLTDARGGGGKYLSYLRKRCPGSQFDNYGRGGEMVNQMRRRFMQDILGPAKPTYTHVIVFGGVNDVYSDQTAKRTPAKIQADLLAMYTMAKEAGIHVVALTIAPWGGSVAISIQPEHRPRDRSIDGLTSNNKRESLQAPLMPMACYPAEIRKNSARTSSLLSAMACISTKKGMSGWEKRSGTACFRIADKYPGKR